MLGLIAYLLICAVISLIAMRYEDMSRNEPDSAVLAMFVLCMLMAPLYLVYFMSKGLAKGIRKIVAK